MKKTVFYFDLDNTLCTTKKNNYLKSKPKKNIINFVNRLYKEGHIIKIYTARYMGRNNDMIMNEKKIFKLTSKQIKKWGLKFHKLFISKPSADIYIDDKAYGYRSGWTRDLKKYIKKNK